MNGNKKVEPTFLAAAIRKMPSFKNEAFDVADLEIFFAEIGFKHSAEQVEDYKQFWKDAYNGKIPFGVMHAIFCDIDDTAKVMRACVLGCDANGDGLVSEDEFKACLTCMLSFDPDFPRIKFDNFLKEADTNNDGVVSTEEAIAWFIKASTK